MIIRKKIVVEETIATVISEEKYFPLIVDEIKLRRIQLKEYIKLHPEFLTSLTPVKVFEDSPEIVKKMDEASKKYDVGPMAAVAGAIGYYAVKRVVKEGGKHIIFDNGGDITMFLDRSVTIGIYTGKNRTRNLGINLKPSDEIINISTSSGKIGHSLSFGKADVVSVISSDPFLADVAATSICNKVKVPNNNFIAKTIEENMKEGIDGILIVMDNFIGISNGFPELIKVNIDYNLITRD